jgi:serine/threonine protein kinase
MESTTPPPSGVTPNIRGFRDLHLLGEGAMGDVYRAERIDAVPGSPAYVALKVLNKARIIQDLGGYSEADRERILRGVVARFRAEHEAGSNVCHPGILAYYKTDSLHSDEGHEFFAMEYAPGVTLDKHVAAKYPLDATDQRNLRSKRHPPRRQTRQHPYR